MNCEAYIIYYQAGKVEMYPNNIDTAFLSGIFASLPFEAQEDRHDWLAIQRRGDMVYYAFLAPLVGAGKDKVGLMVGLNNILITDILALTTFMRFTLRHISRTCHIARYKESLGEYKSESRTRIYEAQASLRDRFNRRFDYCGTPPGPTDYGHTPQTDLRTQLPDGTLEHSFSSPSPAQSVSKSVEIGNILLVQCQYPEARRIAELKTQLDQLGNSCRSPRKTLTDNNTNDPYWDDWRNLTGKDKDDPYWDDWRALTD